VGNHPHGRGFVTTTQEDDMQTTDTLARTVAAFGTAVPTSATVHAG
jgi:hypothetical protein